MSKKVSMESWKKLYILADEIKNIAPWEFMTEMDVFVVESRAAGEKGFVSILGELGEHFAITVYKGEEAFYKFLDFEEAEQYNMRPEYVLEIPQMQLSFENRSFLYKEDLDVIKKLSLQYKGAQAWPCFRSFRPGFIPWILDHDEALLLGDCLEQTIHVANRFRDDESYLDPEDHYSYLLRKQGRGDNGKWEDALWEDQGTILNNEPLIDQIALEKAKKLPFRDMDIAVDLFMMPEGIQDKPGTRPYYLYILAVLDAQTGIILANELLNPHPHLEAMRDKVPGRLVQAFKKLEFLPSRIHLANEKLYDLIIHFQDYLPVQIKLYEFLPAVQEFYESMMEFGRRGRK